MEKEEAEKYKILREDLAEQQVVLYLLKLFHCEQDIKTAREDIAKKQQNLGKVERRKEKAEEILREKKKEHTIESEKNFDRELKKRQLMIENTQTPALEHYVTTNDVSVVITFFRSPFSYHSTDVQTRHPVFVQLLVIAFRLPPATGSVHLNAAM